MSKLRSRLTYANLISTLSLFLVLSGGIAYAASHLPKNSVGPLQLRKSAVNGAKVKDGSLSGADLGDGSVSGADIGDGSLAGADLQDGAVTGAKVKDGSLTGADIDASTLGRVPSAAIAGSATPSGPAGGALTGAFPNPEIADGAVTPAKLGAGIPHDVQVVEENSPGSSEALQSAVAKCPPGEQVIGGGALSPFLGATGFVALTSDGPIESKINSRVLDEWEATAIEVNGGSTQSWEVHVWAICARF